MMGKHVMTPEIVKGAAAGFFATILLVLVSGLSVCLLNGSGSAGDDPGDRPAVRSDDVVTDYDGNVYRTVQIGTQVWMVENLRVTHYRDGTPIPNVFDDDEWPLATDGAYCMFENDSIGYKSTYGVLYNFYAVDNSRGLCPDGWHVPSESECKILVEYLGGTDAAGIKIRDNDAGLWRSKHTNATNESGFCGLPAGGRGQFGAVGEVGYYATWWSSTAHGSLYAWHWGVYPEKDGIRANPGHKASGFSVRCIKD